MFDRNDPLNNYLKTLNYNAVRHPSANIKPLQLFARYKTGIYLFSELTTLLDAGALLPTIIENTQAATISGRRTGDIEANVGISVMETFIQAVTITFEFNHVLGDGIDLGQLDACLNSCSINPHIHTGKVLLDQNNIYIVTRTLKSNEFAIEVAKSNDKTLSINIPLVQQIVGGNVRIEANTTEHVFKLTFKGDIPLVFGLQAVRLYYANSKFLIRPANMHFILPPPPTYLENDGTLLRISDQE